MDEEEICQEIEEQCRLIRENNGVKPEWMQRLAEMEARRWRNTLNRLAEYENSPGRDENSTTD